MTKIFKEYFRYTLYGAICSKEKQIVFNILKDIEDLDWKLLDEKSQEKFIKKWIKETKLSLKEN